MRKGRVAMKALLPAMLLIGCTDSGVLRPSGSSPSDDSGQVSSDTDEATQDSDDDSGTSAPVCEPREIGWRTQDAPIVGLFAGGGIAWHPATGLRTWGGAELNGAEYGPEWTVGFSTEPWSIPDERWQTLFHTQNSPCMVHLDGTVGCRKGGEGLPESVVAVAEVEDAICWMASDGEPGCDRGSPADHWPLASYVPHDLVSLNAGRTYAWSGLHPGVPFTCALDRRGRAWCDGLQDVADVFADPSRCWVELQSDAYAICGIDGWGSLACVIEGPDGYTYADDLPTRQDLSHLSVSSDGGCALDPEGHIVCWGFRSGDVLGEVRTEIPTDAGYVDVVAGDSAACGVRADGTVRCWGLDGISAVRDQPDVELP